MGVATFGANAILLLLKAGVWIGLAGGLALGSEAVNSAIDSVYSVVVLVGLYYTTKAADRDHPHGHERIEPFVSLLIALGALALGAGLLFQAIKVLFFGVPPTTPSLLGAVVLIATILVKYAVYQYSTQVGARHGSPAATAIALDNRNDILTAAAAVVGIVAASMGFPIFDALAGGVVSLGILYTGYEIASKNVRYLVGRAPPEALQQEIVDAAMSLEEVKGVHDVVPHYVGPEVDVSLHVEVCSGMTLEEAHELETNAIRRIERIDCVDDVYVHVDPQ